MDDSIRQDSQEIASRLGPLNKRFSDSSVLLTGCAGFLGSQFMHYFTELNNSRVLDKPVKLFALDNLGRGEPAWVAGFKGRSDVSFLQHDITRPLALDAHFDYIIHAASIASPTYYRQHPIETMDANVQGLRLLLDRAVNDPPRSMLFFSSSEIHGDPAPEHIPTPETYWGNVSCTGPRACYDESKRYGETLCVNFHRARRVPVRVVRPFNNYGPGLKISDRRVLPDFFRDVLAGRDIVMHSDGSPTRTFCYISDAMTGYLLALLKDVPGEAFNIGADSPEVSMKDLAESVIKASGKALKVLHQPSADSAYLQDNPHRRCPDIAKARRMLGYEPRVGLEEGLARSYRWYLSNPSGEDN
jgi:nucleoside-diphosphate-sugar epimerase